MKEKANMQPLLVAILLIIAGSVSPSNGVDERSYKTPFELIATTLIIVFTVFLIYISWNWYGKHKESKNVNYK